MRVIFGDLWEQLDGFRVVTTNCSYNRLGHAVCGVGIAKQAATKYPGLKSALGKRLKETNRAPLVHVFPEWQIICFPTKRYWSDKSTLSLLRVGLHHLAKLADELVGPIYLPLLCCGYGELEEGDVIPVLEEFLDDRFVLVKRDASVVGKYPGSFVPSTRSDRSLGV